ncbi:MAG: hypothetical protein J7L89_07110 [Bacteroidales bacterium]|nr:hypothetical protein [Bacteroidales bacterium]
MRSFIQQYIILSRLKKRFSQNRLQPSYIPLQEAGSLGILADFRHPDHVRPVIQFAATLHKMKNRCHLLLLVSEKRKELNRFDYEKHFPGMPVELIAADELKWFNIPQKKLIVPFTQKNYDILFRLDQLDNFTLDYIFFKTKARMYAGIADAAGGMIDFEIDIQPKTDLQSLTENLLNYLQTIQSKKDTKQQPTNQKLF